MCTRFNYLWRLFATALSFALFGACGVVWAILYPLITPCLGSGVIRNRRGRRLLHEVFRAYVNIMRGLGILNYQIYGEERLNQPGLIVVANHPTLIDVVFLVSFIQNACCIIKPALLSNPFMRAPLRTVDYVHAQDPEILLKRCAQVLSAGSSLIIFPQGTRTPQGENRPFQRGAANIALQSGAKILPVYIHCFPSTLTKDKKWYQIPPERVDFRIYVGEVIDPFMHTTEHERGLAARQITRYLQDYFVKQEEFYRNTDRTTE